MKSVLFLRTLIIAIAFLCLSPLAKAQPSDGGPDPDPNNGAPLDLGITVLVAAGIGFAAKKRYDLKKKDKMTGNTEK